MLISVGNDKYENLVTDLDFFEVMYKRISPEFAIEVRERIQNELEDWADDMFESSCDDWPVLEQLRLRNNAEEAYDLLQELYEPLTQGKKINRQKTMKVLAEVIELLKVVE